jgi:hypothetical protein
MEGTQQLAFKGAGGLNAEQHVHSLLAWPHPLLLLVVVVLAHDRLALVRATWCWWVEQEQQQEGSP